MNNEKVYIEGYVVGFIEDTTGTREKRIQVSSGDIVDIEECFIHKSIAPEKVEVTQFVADWYEENKDDFDYKVWECVFHDGKGEKTEMSEWICRTENAFITLVNMHQFGYEVEKEKRYLVKMKNMSKKMDCLAFKFGHIWVFRSSEENEEYRTRHTRKELEEADFGWVFSCEGVEVEEVL